MNSEIICNGFKGILRASEELQHEKTNFQYLSGGRNVVSDLQGNYYVMTGWEQIYSLTGITSSNLYYSTTLRRLLWTTGTTIYILNPDTNAVNTGGTAIVGSSNVSWEEWPAQSVVLVHDGFNLYKMFADGTMANIAGAPAAQAIKIFKDTLFIADQTSIHPSTQGDYTTFSSDDIISVPKGGQYVLAFSELDGILRAHKGGTIYAISGSVFSGAPDQKDLQVVDLKVSRSAISKYAVWVEDKLEYFIAYDGIYVTKGGKPERITRNIDPLLSEFWSNWPTQASVAPFNSVWGVDTGARYMLFNFTDGNGDGNHLWRYNTETGDWMEIILTDRIPVSLAFSVDHIRTFIGFADVVGCFSNVSTFDGDVITGVIVTNLIDNGFRLQDKQWCELFPYPGDDNSLIVYAGAEGFYPTHPLTNEVNGDTSTDAYEIGPNLWGKLLSLRFSKDGGGKFLCGGFSLGVDGSEEQANNRTWAEARKYATETMMANAPIIQAGSVTLSAGQHSATLPGSVALPEIAATMWTYRGSSNSKVVRLDGSTAVIDNSITVSAGDKLYYVVMAPSRQLFDSYIRGDSVKISTAKYIYHNLNVVPDAVFGITNENTPIVIDNFDARRMLVTPFSAESQLDWIVVKNGTIDNYFRVGFTSGGGTISHGLGVMPSSLILYPDVQHCPTWRITGLTSTTFTYTSSDSSVFFWMVVR